MSLPRPILKALHDLGAESMGYYCYRTPHFFLLLSELSAEQALQPGELRWSIRIGYRPTFDKWGNSTNFETQIWYHPKRNQRFPDGRRRPQWVIPNLRKELQWCLKVCQTNLFEWNSYFSTIKTPWFIYDK